MFKVGDKVMYGNKGSVYTVSKVRPDRRIEVDGNYIGYSPESFTIVDTAALAIQHGGNHYKKLKIQPVEYIMANAIPYMEGNVIKYVSRWKDKGGIEDLKKAKHYLEILIENEQKND